MAKGKNRLIPNILLTIDLDNIYNIPFIITDQSAKIIHMISIPKSSNYYKIRQSVISTINMLLSKYNIDTIIFEQNKLFIDKIDKYPDPYVLKNIMLGFGVQVSIEDNFYNSLTLLALPDYEWRHKVLNRKTTYAIDLYKSHILHRTDIPMSFLVNIENNNYYKAICLSESVLFDDLMDKKYQINKGE